MQRLTVDIETKVLNDLDEKMQTLTKMTVDRPELVKILNKDESDWTPEMAYVYHILYTFAHVFHMRQKKSSKRQRVAWMVTMDENLF
jgi:hypothetical protein